MGIDVGVSGAIGVITDASQVVFTADIPTYKPKAGSNRRTIDEGALFNILQAYEGVEYLQVAVESVGAMPGEGVASSFTFGYSFGLIRGMLVGLGIPYRLVSPVAWKRKQGIPAGSTKAAGLARARVLFPGADLKLVKNHGRADALLIADYLRMVDGGG